MIQQERLYPCVKYAKRNSELFKLLSENDLLTQNILGLAKYLSDTNKKLNDIQIDNKGYVTISIN